MTRIRTVLAVIVCGLVLHMFSGVLGLANDTSTRTLRNADPGPVPGGPIVTVGADGGVGESVGAGTGAPAMVDLSDPGAAAPGFQPADGTSVADDAGAAPRVESVPVPVGAPSVAPATPAAAPAASPVATADGGVASVTVATVTPSPVAASASSVAPAPSSPSSSPSTTPTTVAGTLPGSSLPAATVPASTVPVVTSPVSTASPMVSAASVGGATTTAPRTPPATAATPTTTATPATTPSVATGLPPVPASTPTSNTLSTTISTPVTVSPVVTTPVITTRPVITAPPTTASPVTAAPTTAAPTTTPATGGPAITGVPGRIAGVEGATIASTSRTPTVTDGVGAFRTFCGMSHMAFDDPIVAPGRPGGSHLHTFFGNTGVDAFSTAATIAGSGGSTCRGGTANRSAYWVPSMIDTSTGAAVAPAFLISYYKSGYLGVSPSEIQAFPPGLRMISGRSTATAPDPAPSWRRPVNWNCGFDSTGNGTAFSPGMQQCSPGQFVRLTLAFPQCWNGRDLDSPDHQSHMAWADGTGCPASHPVALAQVTMNFYWPVPDGGNASWRLASDMYAGGDAGWSGHADWWNGWDPAVEQVWIDRCVRAGIDCSVEMLGDGRELVGGRF